ncbi:type I DNA topoisomerase [Candidatus Gottesmanbacteria bacterium]|nr:type I DNA topoisomerase [Candidatus Gottesmanbacteria bacterium]
MNLIIVESPTKARTLTRFLSGKGTYQIEATMGHVRDLPKAALGVDVDHDFAPSYIIPKLKQKRVGELKAIAKKADSIILATDPDREGEAIAWHVAQILVSSSQLSANSKKKKKVEIGKSKTDSFQRIVFHEITEHAISEAIAHPREIDLQLVDAQQARRVLDRLVGYKLSPLLWQKLSKRWLSAGRVQSVAVRLIVEREREIVKFGKEEFWTIQGEFNSTNTANKITAQLVSKDGLKYEKTLSFELFDGKYSTASSTITSESEAQNIIKDLKAPFTVSAVDKKEVRRYPAAPFTTSTLQQEAGRRLYFSAKKTMQLAQKLYEEGHITYHRTDSVNLADKFATETRDFIVQTFGKTYVPEVAREYKTKSKVAQEAHEAIRPTDARMTHEMLQRANNEYLNRDHLRLYELIWKRAVASQAAEAVFDSTTIGIANSNGYAFACQGSVVKFDGYLKIIGKETDEVIIPDITVGQSLTLANTITEQHFTSPPPRYTEASLIKVLEEKGIGRPSTYAPIISTIQERQYVTREEKKLVPTELGNSVVDFLVKYFPGIMALPFTAAMEDDLDAIANGEKQWVPVIAAFYEPFSKMLTATYEQAEKVKVEEEIIDEKCPSCGNALVIRMGRYGKFIACTTFPACKYTRQFAEKIGQKCPKCGGDIVIRKTRRGKTFYGCSNWPKCAFAAWKKEDIK